VSKESYIQQKSPRKEIYIVMKYVCSLNATQWVICVYRCAIQIPQTLPRTRDSIGHLNIDVLSTYNLLYPLEFVWYLDKTSVYK